MLRRYAHAWLHSGWLALVVSHSSTRSATAAGKGVALPEIAVQFPEQVGLGPGFNAFGHHAHAQFVGADACADDGAGGCRVRFHG